MNQVMENQKIYTNILDGRNTFATTGTKGGKFFNLYIDKETDKPLLMFTESNLFTLFSIINNDLKLFLSHERLYYNLIITLVK